MKRVKRIISFALALICLACVFCSCEKSGEPADSTIKADIYFSDRNFVTTYQELMNNKDKYIGKTVCLQGAYMLCDFDSGNSYSYVYRTYTDPTGCCSYNYGFFFDPAGASYTTDDWLQVVGTVTLTTETADGQEGTYLTVENATITKMETKGSKIV